MRLAELPETQLVSHFRESFLRDERMMIGIGDDCAQIAASEGSFVITTSVMAEDQHFHPSWLTGYEVGTRVATRSPTDIDAIGGRPSALIASMVTPRGMDSDVFLGVVRGLGDYAREVGAGVVDGDLSAGEKLVISITALGYCPGPVVCHNGAYPGDVVVISGTLGYSYAGLDLLEDGYVDPSSRGVEQLDELTPFIKTYHAPRPPLGSGMAAATAGARAMMNLSDGSAADAGRIAQTLGIVVEFSRDAIEAKASQLAPAARVCAVGLVRWVL